MSQIYLILKLPSTYYDVISTNDPLKLKQKCFVQRKPNTTINEKNY